MAFKMNGFPMHTTSAFKQTKNSATLNSGEKVKTTTHKNRNNAEGESQQDVLDKAYNEIEKSGNDITEFNKDERFNRDLTQKEYDELSAEQKEVYDTYPIAEQNYTAVSDSLNNVNNNYTPLEMKSPFEQVHTHRGKKGAHNPMVEHDPPLHQHLVGGRGGRQPKKGLAKLVEKINPFDKQSRNKRQNNKGRKNIANINSWFKK